MTTHIVRTVNDVNRIRDTGLVPAPKSKAPAPCLALAFHPSSREILHSTSIPSDSNHDPNVDDYF